MFRQTLLPFMLVAVTGLLAACASEDAAAVEPQALTATYEVTISNLTSAQPFTPPVVATHRAAATIFEVGEPASFEVKEIAENGNVAPLLEQLGANKHVWDAQLALGEVPPVLPGTSRSLEIEASRGAQFLSFVSMLICTNDGFTGLDALKLPQQVGASVTVYSAGYDAGSELNTEDFADIVPPCQALVGVTSDDAGTGVSNPALAENGVIRHHPNVVGGSDLLPEVHGWNDPVASITVRRTN